MDKWEKIKNNYIDKNIKIIPIQPNNKIPMISEWNKDCSSDFMQILYWYESDHDMNFAIPCFENNLSSIIITPSLCVIKLYENVIKIFPNY